MEHHIRHDACRPGRACHHHLHRLQQPTEEAEYAWDATLWVAGDPGRISPDKVVVDETANTITVSQTGDNNVALLYQTDKVLYVNNAKYFVIQGKGLPIAATKSFTGIDEIT